mgnify:CR=1 FL=1|jgi:heat shock protein HslJ
MRIISFLFVAAFLMQCTAKKVPAKETETSIYNKWILEEIIGFSESIDGNKGKPELTIRLSDSSYFGHSGCNSYRGDLIFGKGGVTFSPGLMTKMACDDKGLENAYLECLHSFTRLKTQNNKLLLFNREEILASFVIAKE